MGDFAGGGFAFAAGGPIGALLPFGKRLIRERGGFAAASALEALENSGAMPKIANAFQLMMKTRLSTPGFGGPFRNVLEVAAAKGAMDLLQTHLSLAQQDPEYMATVGLEHEDPSVASSYADRAHRLGQLSNTVDAAGGEIDKSISRLLGTQPGRHPTFARSAPSPEEFTRVKTELQKLAAAEGDRALADLAPTTAGLSAMAVQNAVKHLLDTAPKDPSFGLPPALQRPWAPPRADLRDWFRRLDTVIDPRSVLDSMRQNNLSQVQIDTLQAVYPRLFKAMQEKMRDRLSEWKEPLSKNLRGHVSQLLGDVNDPAVTQLIQAAHQRSIPPKAGTPDGRQVVDVEKSMATEAQKLENR